MRALVTGGAGFIGSNIVGFLVTRGHDVTVLDSLVSGCYRNIASFSRVRFVQGDVRDPEAVARAISGVEVVFHLAASVGNTRSIEHPIEDSEVNVIGTLRILEAAREHGVRRIVYSSSAGIFGEPKHLPVREDHSTEPGSPYGASKLAAEKHCLAYAKLYGLQAVCLRYFNVYGINQRYDAYGNVIPIFCHRLLHGLPLTIFGDGEQTRDFVSVRDVVQANYKAALADGLTGAYNIGSGTAVTINHLARVMCELSAVRPSVEYRPPRKGDVRHSVADISAAKAAFGYDPSVRLEEGLAEYMAWAAKEML